MPKLKHPESKQVIEVSPAQQSLYTEQGWEVQKAPAAKKTAAKKTTAKASGDNA